MPSRNAKGAWILAAMAAPAAELALGQPWPTTAAEALLGLGACYVGWKLAGKEMPRWLWALQMVWVVLLLPGGIAGAAECWPGAIQSHVICWVLLILAATSAAFGMRETASAAACAFWLIGILMILIMVAGIGVVEPTWLLRKPEAPQPAAAWVFLIPGAAILLPGKRPGGSWLAAAGVIAVIMSALVDGVVPAGMQGENPFYLYSMSLTLPGGARRMEALASVGLTMSRFCLLTLLLSSAGHAADRIRVGWGTRAALVTAIAGGIVFAAGWKMPEIILLLGTFVLWIGIPVLCKKYLEKREKRG